VNGCDCGADPEDLVHYPGCATGQGEPDEPADHYGQ
jgi:hypothetical protein